MKYKIQIQAQSQTLSNEQILSLVGESRLAEIKATDMTPLFKAFTVAHEGAAKPFVIADGKAQEISWPRSAVEKVKGIIKKGLQFFNGHNDDNSTNGRDSMGEVVASGDMDQDGKLHSYVVGYFYPKYKELINKTNAISMEAVWDLVENAGQLVATGIDKITGIALVPQGQSPAFGDAVSLGMVQAYDKTEINLENEVKNMDWDKINPGDIPFRLLKTAIQERGIWSSQVIDVNKQLGTMKIENGKLVFTGGDRDLHALIEGQLSSGLSELQKTVNDAGDSIKELGTLKTSEQKRGAKSKAMEALKDQPDHVKKLAERRYDNFGWKDTEEKTVSEFVESIKSESKALEADGFMASGNTEQIKNGEQEKVSGKEDEGYFEE